MKFKIVTLLLVIGAIIALNRKSESTVVPVVRAQKAIAKVIKEVAQSPAEALRVEKKLLLEAQDLSAELSSLRQKRQTLFKQIEFLKEEELDSSNEGILQEIANLDQQKIEVTSRLIEKYSTITNNI